MPRSCRFQRLYASVTPFSIDTRAPLLRCSTLPMSGRNSRKLWFMMPSPFVSVKNWLLKPMRPRAGISNSILVCPSPVGCIETISAFLRPSFSITVPLNSSGTSHTSSSNGSQRTPSISFTITSGRPRQNSKPSRRIFSAKIVICSSPRPLTLNLPSPMFS